MPQEYQDVTLKVFNAAGVKETVMDITRPELQQLLGPSMIVRCEGQVHWTVPSKVQLYNGVCLQARELLGLPLAVRVSSITPMARSRSGILRIVTTSPII